MSKIIKIDNYKVLDPNFNSGTYGDVYKVADGNLNIKALKLLKK
jgi:hypothetical protein